MDAKRQDHTNAAHDSDDLIAELARLVAKDARNTSAQSEVYTRQEPQLDRHEPDPAPVEGDRWQVQAELETFEEPPYAAAPVAQPRVEPQWDAHEPEDAMPAFDYGAHGEAAAGGSDDPIANLIADAEVEAHARDVAQDDIPPEDDIPFETEPYHAEAADAGRWQETPNVRSEHEEAGERDPLGEIEALIGEAARVSADGASPPRRVRSSFLDERPTRESVDAAESAILAAAAATSSSLRRVEPQMERPEPDYEPEEAFVSDEGEIDRTGAFAPGVVARESVAEENTAYESEYDPEAVDEGEAFVEPHRRRRGYGAFVVPVVAGTLILGMIAGGYFVFLADPGDPGEAPILVADADPLKEVVDVPPAETTATESVVFNEIEGNSTNPDDESLVSRDQTGGASGNEMASVIGAEEGEISLTNRPVRTVTVRPDGTIVTAEDSVAGSNVLPVDRPDVPEVPNSTLTADPIGEAIALAMAGGEPEAAIAAEAGAEAVAATPPADTTGETAEPAGSEADASPVPLPLPRPEGLTGPTTTPVAATTTEAQTASAGTPPAAWVQLSSQRSEDVARAGMADLQSRYGSLFNGATPEVNRVDLGERGIYYRVRLPQPSLAQANTVCGAIQAQGGDCFVMNN